MIKIFEDWYIDADPRCYVLQQIGAPDKDGNPTWKNATYHTTVAQAIQMLMNRKQLDIVRQNNLTLKETLDNFQELNETFKSLLSDLEKSEGLIP